MTKKTIIWLRNDLRLSDNEALNYAYENHHQVIFLYIVDDSIGEASKQFLERALQVFSGDVKQRYDAYLIIKRGDPQHELELLRVKYGINSIFWNRVYEPMAIRRDTQIRSYLEEAGVEVKTFNSSLLFEPSDIKNRQGSYFKVFTPFWRKCLEQICSISAPCERPKHLYLVALDDEDEEVGLGIVSNKSFYPNELSLVCRVSEKEAHDLADDFVVNKMESYKDNRDFPSYNNTSFLSAYLHFGLISPKQVYFKTLLFEGNVGANHFLSELGWREFSYYLLYHFPDLPTKNFKTKFDNFTWGNNPDYIAKWQKGQTGFPLIDAGMRQLYQTGWMHNRVRMVVASFLTKNLLIDWKIGASWFWDRLIDADLASNSASWQWVAGSGVDASPYFRIFNPVTQSQRFDAGGDYIRKWVPEIAHRPDKEIHIPVNPMVDLKSSRDKALGIYKSL